LLVIVTEGEYLSHHTYHKKQWLNVTPCMLVEVHEHFGGNCCLNCQGTKSYLEDGGSRFLRNVASLPNNRAVILVTTVIPSSVIYLFLT